MTYGLIMSEMEIGFRIDIIAAAGEPAGRQVNWSAKEMVDGGDKKAGYKKHSMIRRLSAP